MVAPESVRTPKKRVGSVDVIFDGGTGNWSLALLDFDGKERVGIRWNGEDGPSIGNPQSHGQPTWFILPTELGPVVREQAEQLSHAREGGLLSGYREMANDRERETEAHEWSEGLIADAGKEG
jgi:hypothetical protein